MNEQDEDIRMLIEKRVDNGSRQTGPIITLGPKLGRPIVRLEKGTGGSWRIGQPSVHIFWEDNWALVRFGIWRDIFFMMYEYKFGMVHIVSCVVHLGYRIFVFGVVDLVSSGLRGGRSWRKLGSEGLLRKWASTMLITSIITIIIMRRVVTITITSIELSDGGGQLGTVEVAANPMPPTIHHFNYKSILIIPQLIIQDWACKFCIVKYVVFEGYDQTFLILMILITDDWLVTSGYLRWSHGLSARIRVWQIYSNIRIYWSRIYIRTFVRIYFSFTNIFGHSFVSNLFVRIYSDIRWWVC